MNNDQMAGKFEQLKGEIKKAWGKLTDDDVLLYNGQKDKFLGKVQEKYGLAREAAEERMKEIEKSCGCSSSTSNKNRAA